MNKKVTLFFTFRNYNKVKNSDVDHPLILKLLPHNKQTKTSYHIPPKHWDKNAQQVKRRYWDQHPELVKQVNIYKDRFVKYYPMIESGEISPDVVCSEILHTRLDIDKDQTLLEYIDNNSLKFGKKSGTVNKHKANIRGVQKGLELAGFRSVPIRLNMLKSDKTVMQIADGIYKHNIMNTTRKEYFKTLDLVSRKALDRAYHNPFKIDGYYPSNAVARTRVSAQTIDFDNGLNSIKTYRDIEAYLLWLYSFVLQGMDVVDLANIDEGKILKKVGDKKYENLNGEEIQHYHPFGDLIGTVVSDKSDRTKKHIEHKNQLTQKWYMSGVRAKSAGEIDGMYNLFPALYIRDWLHYIMQLTSPDLVYKGKDRLRLFNIQTRNSKGNEIEGATHKISTWSDYRSRRQKKLFGVSLQESRHTYTQIGKKYFGYSEGQMDYQLNHSVRSMANTYQKGEDAEEVRDYRHNQLISYFEINDILFYLGKRVEYLYKNGLLIYDRKERAIPQRVINGKTYKSRHKPPYPPITNSNLIAQILLKHSHTSEWTKELQREYDMLKMDALRSRVKTLKKDGTVGYIRLTPDHPKYPKRIKELDEIRKRAAGDIPIMISEGGGIALTPQEINQTHQETKNMSAVNKLLEKG